MCFSFWRLGELSFIVYVVCTLGGGGVLVVVDGPMIRAKGDGVVRWVGRVIYRLTVSLIGWLIDSLMK